MSNPFVLDQLSDLIADRLGLARQNLRREKLQTILDTLAMPADELAGVASLRGLGFRAAPWQALIAEVTIPETRFLRQPGWFRQIERLALAPLIRQRRQRGDRRLRIWSAACATGEEAYSLAMLVNDLLPDRADWQIEVLGTDINAEALRTAEGGVYSVRQLRELDPLQVSRHFDAVDAKRHMVSPELRKTVRFRPANLAEDSLQPVAAGGFDLIVCRNVLIYFTPETQRRVGRHLSGALRDGGWLAVAPAEAVVDWFRPLTPVNAPEAILFCKQAPRPRQSAPARPGTVRLANPEPPAQFKSERAGSSRTAPVAPATLEEVKRLADRGALAQARALCESLLAQDELDGEACLLLSAICSELGDMPNAYQAARRAVYLWPASAQAHLQLAGALRNMGRAERADKTMAIANELAAVEQAAGRGALQNGAGDGDGR